MLKLTAIERTAGTETRDDLCIVKMDADNRMHIRYKDGHGTRVTTAVRDARVIGTNVFEVYTQNSVYRFRGVQPEDIVSIIHQNLGFVTRYQVVESVYSDFAGGCIETMHGIYDEYADAERICRQRNHENGRAFWYVRNV